MELPFDDLSDHLFSGALEPEAPPAPLPETRWETTPETAHASQGTLTNAQTDQSETPPELSPGSEIPPKSSPYLMPEMRSDTPPEETKAALAPNERVSTISGSVIIPSHTSEPLYDAIRRRHACENVVTSTQLSSVCAARISSTVKAALTKICQSGEVVQQPCRAAVKSEKLTFENVSWKKCLRLLVGRFLFLCHVGTNHVRIIMLLESIFEL